MEDKSLPDEVGGSRKTVRPATPRPQGATKFGFGEVEGIRVMAERVMVIKSNPAEKRAIQSMLTQTLETAGALVTQTIMLPETLMMAQSQLCQGNALKKLKTDGFDMEGKTLQAE